MFYVIPTPIGNLDDITFRTIKVIKSLDVLYCEDPRHTSNMLTKLGIEGVNLQKYVDQNEKKLIPQIIEQIKQNKIVGIVSDAGYPVISDPGYKLISEINKQDLKMEVLPGASSILPSLIYSSFPVHNFVFIGFLQKKQSKIISDISKFRGTSTIFFESPKRIVKTLKILNDNFPESYICVCREISKMHEDIKRGNIKDIYNFYSKITNVKGEIVCVLLIDNEVSHV
jgi:16S rRNA (cytidine1402-2'-O)-methyltransferase